MFPRIPFPAEFQVRVPRSPLLRKTWNAKWSSRQLYVFMLGRPRQSTTEFTCPAAHLLVNLVHVGQEPDCIDPSSCQVLLRFCNSRARSVFTSIMKGRCHQHHLSLRLGGGKRWVRVPTHPHRVHLIIALSPHVHLPFSPACL